MTHVNLDYNTIEKDGVTFLAKQLQYGQGGDYMDPKNPANNSKGKLFQAKYPWKWANLSMRENDINDMAMDDMCAIVH